MSNIFDLMKLERRKFLKSLEEKKKYNSKYKVEGGIQGKDKMLFVLSGYKPYLWEDVFKRIKAYQRDDMEVCIASSGKYCNELSKMCSENKWVYVSTELNNICVVTNIVMRLFDKAQYIFKLDEDIYIPKGYFDNMIDAYDYIEKHEDCRIGYICPILPLGFYGMHEFLKKENCLSEYEEKFGRHRIGGTIINPIFRQKGGVDGFIWEKIGVFDECAARYSANGFSYEACFARSGIAAILYKRDFWERLGGLKHYRGKGIGNDGDEGQITTFCALNFQLTFCVKNILVGHFSFGGSEREVLALKEARPEFFSFHD
jgi:hypothetical protein